MVVEFTDSAHEDLAGKALGFSLHETETHDIRTCGYYGIDGDRLSACDALEVTTVSQSDLPEECSPNVVTSMNRLRENRDAGPAGDPVSDSQPGIDT